MGSRGGHTPEMKNVCMCMCVYVRKREREKGRDREERELDFANFAGCFT